VEGNTDYGSDGVTLDFVQPIHLNAFRLSVFVLGLLHAGTIRIAILRRRGSFLPLVSFDSGTRLVTPRPPAKPMCSPRIEVFELQFKMLRSNRRDGEKDRRRGRESGYNLRALQPIGLVVWFVEHVACVLAKEVDGWETGVECSVTT
jgi:hypothetical protein